MALSEEVLLRIDQALAAIQKIDKSLSKAIKGNVVVDTKVAATKIKELRKLATAEFRSGVTLFVSTAEANKKITKTETNVKELRKLISKSIQFDIGTSDAERKLLSLHRAATAVRNQLAGVDVVDPKADPTKSKQKRETSDQVANQRSLNSALTRYNTIVPTSITLAGEFTTQLRNQAIQAGILAGEMRSVADSTQAFTRAAATPAPQLGPGRRELNAILAEDKAAAGRVGRNVTGDLLGPIDTGRVAAIKAEAAAVVQAEKDANAAVRRAGRNLQGDLLGPINNDRVKAIKDQEAAAVRAGTAMRNLGHDSEAVNGQMIAAGRTLTTLFTLPTVVAGAFAAFNEFKFVEVINKVRILTDAFKGADATIEQTRARTEAFRGVFNQIATQTGQTPTDVANGFYYVASAGGEAAAQLSILRVASQGAAIGLGSVEVVADTLTSVLNAYGESNITAAEAGDVLVESVKVAKVEADAFAPQLGRLLPIAANLKIGFDQVGASLAVLTQNGNTAGVASTQLRGIMQTLVRPTSLAAKKLLEGVGLDIPQLQRQLADGGPTAFIDTLGRLRYDSGLTLTELSQLFRRVDAFQGFLSLTDDLNGTRAATRGVNDAMKNTSGNLDEFNRFARDNAALEFKQAISELLVQLQPLGMSVLPIVINAVQGFVNVVKTMGDLLNSSIGGPIAKFVIGILAIGGPALIAVGKIRQIEQAFARLRVASSIKGGFGAFLDGKSLDQLKEMGAAAKGTTDKVGLLGRSLGALPGLLGVGLATGVAFFAGTAIASDDLTTKIVGIVALLGSVVLAFFAAQAAAVAFGGVVATVAGPIGIAAALLVAAVGVWSAYETATNKSRKALDKFKDSLVGLTANEVIKNFGASIQKGLPDILADDSLFQVEVSEIEAGLKKLGSSYDDVGAKIARIVLANPDDVNAQRIAFANLAKELAAPIAAAQLNPIADAITTINGALDAYDKGPAGDFFGSARDQGDDFAVTAENVDSLANAMTGLKDGSLGDIAEISDTAMGALRSLASGGLLEVRNGILAIPTDKLEEAQALLGGTIGADLAKLFDGLAEAPREARKAALALTGEFTTSTNAAGAFKDELEEGGEIVNTFTSNVEEARKSLAGLAEDFETAIAKIFAAEQDVDENVLKDRLDTLVIERAKDLIDIQTPVKLDDAGQPVQVQKVNGKDVEVEIDDKGKQVLKKDAEGNVIPVETVPNEQFVNFQVNLTGPDGLPARNYIRGEIADIDSDVQAYLNSPGAELEVATKMREDALAVLAYQLKITVPQLQAFIEGDPILSNTELPIAFAEADLATLQTQMENYQTLLTNAPLSAIVKTEIENADPATQNALFGSRLIETALQGNTEAVFNFIIKSREEGIPLDTLQGIFENATVEQTKSLIVQAILDEQSPETIAKAIQAIPAEIRAQVVFPTTEASTFVGPDDDNRHLPWSEGAPLNVQVKAILDAAEVTDFDTELTEAVPKPIKVYTDVDSAEIDAVTAKIATGSTWSVLLQLNPTAFNATLAQVRRDVALWLGTVQDNLRNPPRVEEKGGVVQPHHRAFAAGGVINGRHLRREPMIARAPSNMKGILWAEPQTHKESYVPWNPRQRGRAVQILERTAEAFGYELSERVKGTMRMAAAGAVINAPRTWEPSSRSSGMSDLAMQVANLAAVVAGREQQPLIGQATFQSATTNPRTTARYLAEDVAELAGRVMGT